MLFHKSQKGEITPIQTVEEKIVKCSDCSIMVDKDSACKVRVSYPSILYLSPEYKYYCTLHKKNYDQKYCTSHGDSYRKTETYECDENGKRIK